MAAVQRRGALRVASAYRTVSEPAVLVIAGVMPIDLMARERKQAYQRKPELGNIAAASEAREHAPHTWKERWEHESRGRWTARLVGNLRGWLDRKHGEVNYYLTQLLTGHGYFRGYLYKIGKVASAACLYGDSEEDDANHTFFECSRWTEKRHHLTQTVGNITPDNIVQIMLVDAIHWDAVSAFTEDILRQKKREEN